MCFPFLHLWFLRPPGDLNSLWHFWHDQHFGAARPTLLGWSVRICLDIVPDPCRSSRSLQCHKNVLVLKDLLARLHRLLRVSCVACYLTVVCHSIDILQSNGQTMNSFTMVFHVNTLIRYNVTDLYFWLAFIIEVIFIFVLYVTVIVPFTEMMPYMRPQVAL